MNFLRELYPALVHFNAWWFSMNDDDNDGIVQYTHPYSSGLDDSPLWDYGLPVESPDINTYLYLQMEALARIAEILGQNEESKMWERRNMALVRRMVKDMWDDEKGLFCALVDEKPIPVVTPFNLFPLWTGQLSPKMNERLIEHLLNPEEFSGPYIIPTVARNDPNYNPEVMWRGPVWANINYFFIEALEKVGEGKLADKLMERTLEMIAVHKDIYEYYSAETGEPPATAANIFGWTAAVYIDLAIRASQAQDQEGLTGWIQWIVRAARIYTRQFSDQHDLIIVSNRGPYSFYTDEGGEIKHQRSGGGLVTALLGLANKVSSLGSPVPQVRKTVNGSLAK